MTEFEMSKRIEEAQRVVIELLSARGGGIDTARALNAARKGGK